VSWGTVMSKTILIATGTSMNKRNRAVNTVVEFLKKKGIGDVNVVADNAYTMNLAAIKPDVIVLIGPKTFTTTAPILDGTAFVTQIASQVTETCEKIAALVAPK